MDPSYQQQMIQQLMGQSQAAPGMGGQNAASPYGQNFITGNQMTMPSNNGMLTNQAPNNQSMAQPYATYSGMA